MNIFLFILMIVSSICSCVTIVYILKQRRWNRSINDGVREFREHNGDLNKIRLSRLKQDIFKRNQKKQKKINKFKFINSK